MHDEVRAFVSRMKSLYPAAFAEAKNVVEFGSYNVNGTPRDYFPLARYVGVDWRPGPCVNVVSLAHEYKGKDESFDMAVSTEMFEHDPHWEKSVARMLKLVKRGGSVLITCAGPERHAHDVKTSPDGSYKNPTMRGLLGVIYSAATFKVAIAEDDAKAHDLRFFGFRKR